MVISSDISRETARQREIEIPLNNSETRFRTIFENVSDAIIYLDEYGNIVDANNRVKDIFGYEPYELVERNFASLGAFDMDNVLGMVKFFKEAIQGKHSDLWELEIRRKDGSVVSVEGRFSFLREPDGRATEILAIVRDISERRWAEEQSRLSTEKLVETMENTIRALAMIVEMRDPYTAGHQRRVAQLALAIAERMGLSEGQINAIRLAGLIHDIGKVRVPAEILTHPNGLSEAEFAIIKTHPLAGYEILKTIEIAWPIAQIVYQHHERMNGSGYPQGLAGEDIIMEARIMAVSDVVESMASRRPYRSAFGLNKALVEISQKCGVLYDSAVVDACLELFAEQKFKFE